MWPFEKKPVSPLVSSKGLAIVIIDMQPRFLENHDPLETGRIVDGQLKLIEQAARTNTLVVNVRYGDYGDVHPEVFQAWLGLANKAPVLKNWNDAFTLTNLRGFLAGRRIRTLILAGINASFCVWDTADTAVRLGYRVHVADDLIADQIRHKDENKSRDRYRRRRITFHESPIIIEV